MKMGEKFTFLNFFVRAFLVRVRRLAKLLVHATKFFVGGKIEKADYFVIEEVGVAYLVMPKAACSSIKRSMVAASAGERFDGNNGIHGNSTIQRLTVRGKLESAEDRYLFTYVRNPFARLVSAYINKFEDMEKIRRSGFLYEEYLGGYLKVSDTFEEFVTKIAKIPDRVCDRHFMSQSYLIDHLASQRPSEIFKLEEIDQSFPALVERFGFSSLSFANKSEKYDYREYYKRQEVLDMVYSRYKTDVERFGYGSDYELIKRYINECHEL